MNDTLKYNTISSLRHITVLSVGAAMFFATACNEDDIPDPYVPVNFSKKITRIDFISGNDSTVYKFDSDMKLTSGRDNNATGIGGYEWFTMQYSGSGHLTGAVYVTADNPFAHAETYQVTCSSDDRDMLSRISFGDWRPRTSRTFSFSYDADYRLAQLTMNDGDAQTINRYTMVYDDNSNVTSVEIYKKSSYAESTTKIDYGDYDTDLQNPFRYLVNVFYAPYFTSGNGAIFYDKIPLAMLLSKNTPGKAVETTDTQTETSEYKYQLGDDGYPVGISGGGLFLTVKYYP